MSSGNRAVAPAVFRVRHDGTRWMVCPDSDPDVAIATADVQKAAIDLALDHARRERGEVVIYGRDGRLLQVVSFVSRLRPPSKHRV